MLPSCIPVRRAISELGSPCALQDQDLPVGGRAFLQHPLPQLALLSDLARAGLIGLSEVLRRGQLQRTFLFQCAMMLPATVDEPVTSDFDEERAKVGAVGEPPTRLTKATQDVGPDRLDDVHRVELGPQGPRQLPADRHA